MKHSLIFLLAACLCLCNCSQFNRENNEGDPTTKSSWELLHPGEILLSPYTPYILYDNDGNVKASFQNSLILDFDKNGGQAKVIAYYPAEDMVTLNEEYKTGAYNGEIPRDKVGLIDSQVSVTRTKLDDFRSEYALTVHPNRLEVDYEYYIQLYDFSHKRKDGSPVASKAVITVHQTAE